MILKWLFRRSVRLSMLLDLCVWFLAITMCLSALLCIPIAVCSCPVCRSRSDSPSSLLALFLFASRYSTGHHSVHVAPLCAYRPTTSAFRLGHVIGLPSPPIILVGFLVTSVVSFDMLSIIVVLCYSLNFPWFLEWWRYASYHHCGIVRNNKLWNVIACWQYWCGKSDKKNCQWVLHFTFMLLVSLKLVLRELNRSKLRFRFVMSLSAAVPHSTGAWPTR